MARGRMLNKSVGASKKFHDLPDDTCRLLASWIIPHLDKNGVFHAEPALVKSYVFPRRIDIDEDQIAAYMEAMEKVGLIVIFSENGDAWQHWPGFAHNQIGLRADRETTAFPQPSGNHPEPIRQPSSKQPAEVKLSESKLIELGADAPTQPPQSETPEDRDFREGFEAQSKEACADPPPRQSEAEILAGNAAASAKGRMRIVGEPWRSFLVPHSEMKSRPGVSVEQIQQVGHRLETEFGLTPLWRNKKETKAWVTACAELYQACGGRLATIIEAGKRLRGGDPPMTLSGPRSFIKTTRAIVAERRSPAPAAGGQRWRTLPPIKE